jgi:hypothetical protein
MDFYIFHFDHIMFYKRVFIYKLFKCLSGYAVGDYTAPLLGVEITYQMEKALIKSPVYPCNMVLHMIPRSRFIF